MDSQISGRHAVVLLIVAVALLAWGVAGFIDRADSGRGGFTYSPDYVVNYVSGSGAASEAGLEIGDRVITVEGIAVEDLPLYSRWPRSLAAKAGDTRRLVVERDGETVTADVVYKAQSIRLLHVGTALIGLAFMGFGLWAVFTAPTLHAWRLAYVGVAAGLATFGGGGPYLGTWDGLSTHIQAAGMMLWIILLLRFFLTFPTAKRPARSRLVTGLIYAPWVLFLGCLVLELIFHPTLYHTFGFYGSLLNLLYLLLALAALVHTVLFSARRRLRETGVSLILWGILIAVVPTVVAFVDWQFIWNFDLPGWRYYALALAAFPLALALAVKRQAKAEPAC